MVRTHASLYLSQNKMSDNKAFHIQRILNDLYPDPPVPLDSNDDFTFLIAVILSAQTTDGAVNIVTKDLFKLAPDAMTLSKMTPIDVQKIIQRVGLAPKKSVYIIETAKAIIERFHGKVPTTLDDLKSLPGVGTKTASVVLSQVLGMPAFAVDTHIHRQSIR